MGAVSSAEPTHRATKNVDVPVDVGVDAEASVISTTLVTGYYVKI